MDYLLQQAALAVTCPVEHVTRFVNAAFTAWEAARAMEMIAARRPNAIGMKIID